MYLLEYERTIPMDDNSFFRSALSDFAFDAAYGDSIRHLYNRGFTPQRIKDYLGAESLTLERICEVIEKYKRSGNEQDPS